MILRRNGVEVDGYIPSYSGRKIIIAIDSSKSNTAIVVGDTSGVVLDDYEISGRGTEVNVYQLCWDTRNAIKILFQGADVVRVGIENVITKKNTARHAGQDYHYSRTVINAVFNNFIFYFQDYHGITPILVNNQTWKAETLPEEYRKRTHNKGSLDYFKDTDSVYGSRSDDVTDAICIFRYLCKLGSFKLTYDVNYVNDKVVDFDWSIFPAEVTIPENRKEFIIKNEEPFLFNLSTIASMLDAGETGYLRTSATNLTLQDIYSDRLKYSDAYPYRRGCTEVLIAIERR